ncbi:phosphoribosylglycinamide formyltransferase [Flagellimonas meishanensis]|uniref:phosphoribosylglycinamide formyltransferase n=1 Tax=Flagellimonas meishanensis TaxID=2873264 RepID=UPI001CA7A6C8|nr:phosphoribosylglycinamide formyltransferase [[Muricauda] meishanensis]
MKRIVILASGSGSNAENIITHFSSNPEVEIVAVLTNRKDAKVLERCARLEVPALYFNKKAFSGSDVLLRLLKGLTPDLIVLAGFLWKIPSHLIQAFPNKIINIHPALLPKYGGKGMYGDHVHRAVKDNSESETGITIHYVNKNYDEGAIIHQAKTSITPNDTVGNIAQKVHQLEYEHFPKVIEKIVLEHGKES